MRNVNLSILYSARELATICNNKEKLEEIDTLISKEESIMKESLSFSKENNKLKNDRQHLINKNKKN